MTVLPSPPFTSSIPLSSYVNIIDIHETVIEIEDTPQSGFMLGCAWLHWADHGWAGD